MRIINKYEIINLDQVFNNNKHRLTKNYVDGNGIERIHIAG
jgi:hypothetical protein